VKLSKSSESRTSKHNSKAPPSEPTTDQTNRHQAADAAPQRVKDDANWAKLRRFFLGNARRLSAKVENNADGRTHGAYDRIGWKRPRLMVEKMSEGGLISNEVAQASLGLIDRFNTFKPRHSAVLDEVVGAMEVLDH
jgi:hypothetical protein